MVLRSWCPWLSDRLRDPALRCEQLGEASRRPAWPGLRAGLCSLVRSSVLPEDIFPLSFRWNGREGGERHTHLLAASCTRLDRAWGSNLQPGTCP